MDRFFYFILAVIATDQFWVNLNFMNPFILDETMNVSTMF